MKSPELNETSAIKIALQSFNVRFFPLFRFFLRTRMSRAQAVVALLYLAAIIHLSFFSLKYNNSVMRRLELYWMFMPFLWPIWLTDDDFDIRGAIRLFIIPRSQIRSTIASYLAARIIFATLIGTFSIILAFNLKIFQANRFFFLNDAITQRWCLSSHRKYIKLYKYLRQRQTKPSFAICNASDICTNIRQSGWHNTTSRNFYINTILVIWSQ